jgi:hypothetical protein
MVEGAVGLENTATGDAIGGLCIDPFQERRQPPSLDEAILIEEHKDVTLRSINTHVNPACKTQVNGVVNESNLWETRRYELGRIILRRVINANDFV